MCKVTLLSTVKASTSVAIFFLFFFGGGLADYGSVHSIIVLRRKIWARGLRAVSLTAPVLVVGV